MQKKWEIPEVAIGVGVRDTTRGALGHWITIEGKKIKNYKESLIYLEKLLEIEPQAIHARALKKLLLQKYIV